MSAHLSSSARRTEARPVGYRSLASERCFRATSRRRTTLRSPNSRLGRGNVDRHRDRDNDDEIVHALAVHRAECADDQLCERGQERTRQEQPKSRSAPPRHPRTGPRKLEAKSRILFKLPHAERFSNDTRGDVDGKLSTIGKPRARLGGRSLRMHCLYKSGHPVEVKWAAQRRIASVKVFVARSHPIRAARAACGLR